MASRLREDGFAVLSAGADGGSTLDSELCARVSEECHERLETLLAAADDAGCNIFEQQYSFSQICHRKPRRWDMRMPQSAAWDELCERAVDQAAPVLRALCDAETDGSSPFLAHPRVVMRGLVVSRQGAEEQSFHADGDGRLFNIFVPLVDIEADGDGTQFWPGSHKRTLDAHEVLALPQDDAAMAQMESPACPAGGAIIFDYRTIHRGRANDSRERAVAYIVVAVDETTDDVSNFPARSVHNCATADAESMPFWNERAGDTWRALQPRMRSAVQRLANRLRSMTPACDASDDADDATWREAKSRVREYCDSHGLDRWSSHAQMMAANELCRELEQAPGF